MCGKSQYLGTGIHWANLELEFEVMGLNWAVGLLGHFAGIFAGMYIFG